VSDKTRYIIPYSANKLIEERCGAYPLPIGWTYKILEGQKKSEFSPKINQSDE
jgi:hypothetical protein